MGHLAMNPLARVLPTCTKARLSYTMVPILPLITPQAISRTRSGIYNLQAKTKIGNAEIEITADHKHSVMLRPGLVRRQGASGFSVTQSSEWQGGKALSIAGDSTCGIDIR